MRTWIIVISFIISLTGLLFKTTEEGKNGIKKLNKWGIILLSFMIMAVVLNFITSRQEKIDADLALQKRIEKDSFETFEKQSHWRIDSLKMQNIVDRLQLEQGDVKDIKLPIDSLLLSFNLVFKIKNEQKFDFYESSVKGGEWYPRYDINRFELLSEQNKSLFADFSTMLFTVTLQTDDLALAYKFNFEDVPKFLDNSFNFNTGFPNKETATYSGLYYDFNSKQIQILTNKAKCNEIEKMTGNNLSSICKTKCFLSIFSLELPTSDFEVDLMNVELSNAKNDHHITFEDFQAISPADEETYEWYSTQPSHCEFK